MGRLAETAVARLRTERDETLRSLLGLDDPECRRTLQWYGREQSVGHMLRAFTSHALDHFQHLHRLLQARGRPITEAQLLLMKAESAQAELEALLLSLSDEELTRTGPNEGDWSAAQILDHVIETERRYRAAILEALEVEAPAAKPSRPP